MSKPANPLSKYRSHSYYHVLAICDSTDSAEALSTSTSLDVWQHSTGSANDQYELGQMSAKLADPNGSGQYCILINGSTDASFSISKASWTSVTNGTATKNDNNTSIAMEGSIDISEPHGIVFLDRVVNCCLQMGIDSSSAVWCLKTFFVGYTDIDTVEYITDIAPIMFIALSVTGSFTEQGGLYNINFVSIAHGASRLPQYAKSGAAVNFKVGADLKSTFASLTTVVQGNYDAYYKCVKSTVEAMQSSGDLQDSLRRTTYIIEAVAPYNDPSYAVDDQLAQASANGDPCNTKVTGRIDANSSIESGIHAIMSMCTKVNYEKSNEDENHLKYGYVIQQTPISRRNSDGTIDYTILYRIKRQVIHNSVSIAQLISGNVPDMVSSQSAELLKQNLIEFDYIYTGRNIDILELDMKLSAGTAYLNIATSVNSYNTSLGGQPNVVHTISNPALKASLARQGGLVHNTQVGFGTIIKNPINRNSSDNMNKTQGAYTMAKHASLEVSQVVCRINGNPQLLNSINKNSSPAQVKKNGVDGATSANDTLAGWGSTPSIAKINIKMPRNNDDASLFTGTQANSTEVGGSGYAVDFWFNGYYNLMEVEHIFDGGEFTQTLNLLGIPDESALHEILDSNKGQTIISSCFNNTIGCKRSQDKPPYAVPEKLPSMDNSKIPSLSNLAAQSPTTGIVDGIPGSITNPSTNAAPDILSSLVGTKADTNQSIAGILAGTGDLDGIEGYKAALPPVKSAIDSAANQLNLTPKEKFLLVNVLSVESGLNATPRVHHDSTAAGLGQFTDAAWKDYGQGDRMDPNAAALATGKYLKNIRVQLTKELGRAPTEQETYLGYKEGIGGATRILTNPRDGDEHKQAVAYHDLARKVTGSVPYVPDKTRNSIMYKDPSIPGIVDAEQRAIKLNRDAIASSKDCNVEDSIKKDNTKRDCTSKP